MDHLQPSYEEEITSKYFPSLKRPRSQDDLEDLMPSYRATSKTRSHPLSSEPHPVIYEDSKPRTRTSIITQIETIFTSLSASLVSNLSSPLQISLNSRRGSTVTFDALTSTIRRSSSATSNIPITFPKDAWRFACILKVLDIVHESLVGGQRAVTKRDIFYKHPKLFRSQRVVDRIVDDLAATFGAERGALGIVASAKGMVYGDVVIGGRSFMMEGGGIVVPGEIEGLVLGEEVQWVLVVEKEAVFRTLAYGGGGRGIVITGKGYPDVATREVVRMLSEAKTGEGRLLPVYILVDMDPYGIEIMATYKFGSVALAHENHRLAVERVEWLGVKSGDLVEVMRGADGGDGEVEGVMVLTDRDRRKAVGILGREWIHMVPEWRSEIQRMLFLNIKAEIEILGNAGMKNWVEEKIVAKVAGLPTDDT